ncbi:hypothetical protein MTO96_018172 [Rhipicephalus appendiculatus]
MTAVGRTFRQFGDKEEKEIKSKDGEEMHETNGNDPTYSFFLSKVSGGAVGCRFRGNSKAPWRRRTARGTSEKPSWRSGRQSGSLLRSLVRAFRCQVSATCFAFPVATERQRDIRTHEKKSRYGCRTRFFDFENGTAYR